MLKHLANSSLGGSEDSDYRFDVRNRNKGEAVVE